MSMHFPNSLLPQVTTSVLVPHLQPCIVGVQGRCLSSAAALLKWSLPWRLSVWTAVDALRTHTTHVVLVHLLLLYVSAPTADHHQQQQHHSSNRQQQQQQ